ncbi:hypothetical protein KFZ58_07705 [Virgibacillus sp. NKC19-16]|uniref:hypothetical protein n=1 Tax=Virgibacillus salidurans TaxID=2831673 RepID=UPI001F32AC40|nr:hypothetical protein [Virgibacillus sp. NKC19-16]UJL47731.1 hypothetical protein KFZ58_07705 [Virgibacillus sp. NKC19-16]
MEQKRIKEQLKRQGIPVIEADLPYIQKLLLTIERAHAPVKANNNLHKEIPLVVVDPEVVQFD